VARQNDNFFGENLNIKGLNNYNLVKIVT
jgi:hypothetical protein